MESMDYEEGGECHSKPNESNDSLISKNSDQELSGFILDRRTKKDPLIMEEN